MNTFAERLRKARQETGLTQAALAKNAGFSDQAAIGNMESGRNKGSRMVVKLAEVLKVNPLWLEKGEGPMRGQADGRLMIPVTLREELCVELFKKLTLKEQDELLKELRAKADTHRVMANANGSPIKKHAKNSRIEQAYGLPDHAK
jgi:transcriptional regulator with XRE-family HTH domain